MQGTGKFLAILFVLAILINNVTGDDEVTAMRFAMKGSHAFSAVDAANHRAATSLKVDGNHEEAA
ncbi:unnamed protein product [Ixodes persulcatus]